MVATELLSERLVLTALTEQDIDAVFHACSDPESQRWTSVPWNYTREHAESFIREMIPALEQEGTEIYALRLRNDASRKLLGWIDLRLGEAPKASIGFMACPEHRGQGYMSEGLSRLLDYAFNERGIELAQWKCWVIDGEPNWASTKVAWKCGFHFDGYVRGDIYSRDELHDTLIASIRNDEPRAPQGPWFGPSLAHPAIGNPRDPEGLVRVFHSTYNLPVIEDKPSVDRDRVDMRMALIAEEFSELVGAVYGTEASHKVSSAYDEAVRSCDSHRRDVVESADALGDLVYVIYGMALEMGIPLDRVLHEIQASNLSKLGADGKPIYREDGKVLKGPHYFPPNIRRALGFDDM